jgi:hypothetical protein
MAGMVTAGSASAAPRNYEAEAAQMTFGETVRAMFDMAGRPKMVQVKDAPKVDVKQDDIATAIKRVAAMGDASAKALTARLVATYNAAANYSGQRPIGAGRIVMSGPKSDQPHQVEAVVTPTDESFARRVANAYEFIQGVDCVGMTQLMRSAEAGLFGRVKELVALGADLTAEVVQTRNMGGERVQVRLTAFELTKSDEIRNALRAGYPRMDGAPGLQSSWLWTDYDVFYSKYKHYLPVGFTYGQPIPRASVLWHDLLAETTQAGRVMDAVVKAVTTAKTADEAETAAAFLASKAADMQKRAQAVAQVSAAGAAGSQMAVDTPDGEQAAPTAEAIAEAVAAAEAAQKKAAEAVAIAKQAAAQADKFITEPAKDAEEAAALLAKKAADMQKPLASSTPTAIASAVAAAEAAKKAAAEAAVVAQKALSTPKAQLAQELTVAHEKAKMASDLAAKAVKGLPATGYEAAARTDTSGVEAAASGRTLG